MGDFRGVSLKASLVNDVEVFVKHFGRYKSVTEFASEAIRLRLEELEKNVKEA
jgi:Arc/MetJ-type ribon-helix-helix transcriptional regulator